MTIEEFNKIKEVVPNGWCSYEKARHLYQLVVEKRPYFSIEIGAFSGRSLMPIAMAHKQNNEGFVLGLDAWSKKAAVKGTNDEANNQWWAGIDFSVIYSECNNAIDHFDLNDYCGTIRLDSVLFASLIPDNTIGFMHQDGNHSEEVSCAEVEAYCDKMLIGSIWVSDDSRWPTIQRSLELLTQKGFTCLSEFPNGDNFYKVFRKK